VVKNKDRVAQMVIVKCETPELVICKDLNESIRGEKGFGSSGYTS
jgi:dUTPase